MANCHDLFSKFHEIIDLPDSKRANLQRARDALRDRIKRSFFDADRTPVPEFRAQGSYAVRTIINPIKGEYDIDDGVYLQNLDKTSDRNWPTPETVHKWICEATESHTDQPPMDKRTCMRVIYAGQYHVDLPIYCELNGQIFHAEKGKKGWHPSDPQAIANWFQNAANREGDQLRRMIRYFKAWTDHNSKDGKLPSGLILTVLTVEKFVKDSRDDVCFGQLVSAVYSRMLSNPFIYNPVDASEDLYARYDAEIKKRFLESIRRLKKAAQDALTAESKKQACKSWRSEFGNRWTDCESLDETDKPRYTKAPAILRNDARSA